MEQRAPRDLAADECMELLGATLVGRLARNHPAGPTVTPVNFVTREGGIIIRSLPGGRIDAAERGEAASFEADGIDERHRSGWTVLLRGHLRIIEPDDIDVPDSFAAGHDDLLELQPSEITGRRLRVEPARPRSWDEVTQLGHVWVDTDARDLMG